jgi:hypothetical protein
MIMEFKSENYPETTYTENQIRQIEAILDDLVYFIPPTKFACASCGKQLETDLQATIYDHDGGWNIIDDIPRQWVSFPCECGYETSLNKLQGGKKQS